MPLAEIMACRKVRLYSQLSHHHKQTFLRPEWQLTQQQGVNLYNFYKNREIDERGKGLKSTERLHLRHFCDLQETSDGLERKRQEKEAAAAAQDDDEAPGDGFDAEDLDHSMQSLGEEGPAPKRKTAPGVARAAGSAVVEKKTKEKKRDGKSSTGAAEITVASAEMEVLKEKDLEMFKVAQSFGQLAECLTKLSVQEILEGQKRGPSVWAVPWLVEIHYSYARLTPAYRDQITSSAMKAYPVPVHRSHVVHTGWIVPCLVSQAVSVSRFLFANARGHSVL